MRKEKVIEKYTKYTEKGQEKEGVWVGNPTDKPIGVIVELLPRAGMMIPERYFLESGEEIPVKDEQIILIKNQMLGCKILGYGSNKKTLKDIFFDNALVKKLGFSKEDIQHLENIKKEKEDKILDLDDAIKNKTKFLENLNKEIAEKKKMNK